MKTMLLLLIASMPGQPQNGVSNPLAGHIHIIRTQTDEEAAREFQCGQIHVRGMEQLTQPETCQLLAGVAQNPLDSESQNSAHENIISEYHRRGFLEANLSWMNVEKQDSTSPAVRLKINEGPIYRLRRLEMIGNDNVRDNVIRRRVALHEGAAFEEELLELSIKRINQLGIFEDFTRQNVDVTLRKKEHCVDLIFRLKEK